ncbi:hypothetical protein ED312_06700 [Sinomicrobium pectinilyticum]|uniref:Uncharacterized protein n=1 Tax=Sinomicrobium pectinilyticum TaxID=1084421 RepID=A0A3N0EQB6_SINP1|nr:hypothetical protein ED312_06700 [Sinomicrobium pectinilyticum]
MRYKLVIALLVLLICLNLTGLYFIYELYTYDEILAYMPDNSIRSDSPRSLAILLYITILTNILYIYINLMARLFTPAN